MNLTVRQLNILRMAIAADGRQEVKEIDLALVNQIDKVKQLQADSDKHKQYRDKAKEEYHEGGSIEVDDDARVSDSEEGAYVQAWVWVYA